MPINPKTSHSSVSKVNPFVFYAVMLCLMIPIGMFAILGTQNERPRRLFYWNELTGDQPCILAFENGPTRAKLYCIDLKTGSLTTRPLGRIRDFLSVSNFNTHVWAYDLKPDDQVVWQWMDMKAGDAVQTREIQLSNQEYSESLCIVDKYAIRLRPGKLDSDDFFSGTTVDSIPCPTPPPIRLEHIKDTKSFLVTEPSFPSSAGTQKRFLFELRDGKFVQTANWLETDHVQISIAMKSYILSLLDDGVSIAVRDGRSGEVVANYVPTQSSAFAVPLTRFSKFSSGRSWLVWRNAPIKYTDALTDRPLPVPAGCILIERDLASNRLVAIARAAKSDGWDCRIVDENTGRELNRFRIALEHYGLSAKVYGLFRIETNQIVFATQNCRFFTYDIVTGKMIRSVDPLLRADWCSRLASFAFGVWCVVWLRVCAILHPHGWVDFAICSGLAVAFCCYQLRNNVDSLFSLPMLCGLFGSWVLAAVAWLAFGKSRWSLRVQPLIFLIGITTGIIAITTTQDQGILAPFVLGLSLLVIASPIFLMPLRFLRFQFQNDAIAENGFVKTPQHHLSTVTLRDVFSLTIAFAFLFAVARWLLVANWDQASLWLSISFFTSVIAIPSLLAFWTAMGRSSWIVRWGLWAILIIGSEILFIAITENTVPWQLVLSAVVPTLFCFYAYRLRGWRLGRVSG